MNNIQVPAIRQVQVMRYITPLREGGSLPAITEGDDGFMYVLKFRGAGQGSKALIADLIGGEMARIAGCKVPELVFANLDEAFGRTEPDEEIQDLLRASEGLNLGVHYLSGAITYDPAVNQIDPLLASKIVWLDALLMNVDRTAKNTNLLTWQKKTWLIDHGAALYFHHNPEKWEEQAAKPFIQIKDHVLLAKASLLQEADALLKPLFPPELITKIAGLIPEEWLDEENSLQSPSDKREMYIQFLQKRLANTGVFLNEAIHARQKLI